MAFYKWIVTDIIHRSLVCAATFQNSEEEGEKKGDPNLSIKKERNQEIQRIFLSIELRTSLEIVYGNGIKHSSNDIDTSVFTSLGREGSFLLNRMPSGILERKSD
ncbi:hypothetical protein AVEN_222622-1 [Araneus ventricosus]|uniref:Uncharacterized protein n=1 Tax=Araneus ventricosus TaxID=182803 RepID=A0A4Y2KFM0_ARAVE|nr:hypothetical protein AVEN_222622-1 [Araneus ventricosus]